MNKGKFMRLIKEAEYSAETIGGHRNHMILEPSQVDIILSLAIADIEQNFEGLREYVKGQGINDDSYLKVQIFERWYKKWFGE